MYISQLIRFARLCSNVVASTTNKVIEISNGIFVLKPGSSPGMELAVLGVPRGSFFESGHVAYQIDRDDG